MGARFALIPDVGGNLSKLYGAKIPLLKLSSRVTYVIGPDRRVLAIFSGKHAIDPSGAIEACALARPGGGAPKA